MTAQQPTVENLVESVFDGALQSYSVQAEVKSIIIRLREDGYEAHAQMIERMGLLSSLEKNYEATFKDVIKNVQLILSEKIQVAKKLGLIPESTSSAIKIGVVFYKERDFDRTNPDHWISLEPHEKIPAGFKLYEGRGLLPGAALWSALARGHFPAMFIAGSLREPIIVPKVFAHDLLGHMTTYLLNPEYALSYMKVAQTIIKKYRQHTAEKGKSYWSFIYKTGLFSRVYVFNEGLTKSRPEVILNDMELFGLAKYRQIPRASELTLGDLIPQTNDLSELSSTLAKLIDLTPQISRPIGGAALVSTQGPSPFSNYINYLVKLVYPRLTYWQEQADSGVQIQVLKKMIGIIRGYHLAMSQLNFEELAVEIFRDQPTPNSPMIHYFSERAGYFSATKEVLDVIGIPNNSYHFGEHSILNRFSEKGWDDPLPAGIVKSQ